MSEREKVSRVYKPDLLYPDLSYQIVGILFDVFPKMGYGLRESQYQRAIEIGLQNAKLPYRKELPVKITYGAHFIATNYLDFLIEDKIILEIKKGDMFRKKDIEQIFAYLKATNLKLGILARFTRNGVKFKRIINLS
jgi:GxxExxY protein